MALTGCAAGFQSGPLKSPNAVIGAPHHSMAPYVKIFIGQGSNFITVGNQSAPQLNNDAVIRDFEYGSADGFSARFTIHDQAGGSLTTFVDRMLKDINRADSGAIKANFEYGWIRTGCPTPVALKKSKRRYGYIDWVETNFADGKFMFDITVKDLGEVTNEAKSPKIYGEDGEKGLPIRQALEKLLTDKDNPPSISKISFKTRKGGRIKDIGFEKPTKGDKNGPKGKWIANNRGKLQTAMEWLGEHLSENGKSWYPVYNDESAGGEVTFWEENVPLCGEIKTSHSLGTYIVNGGKESTVIEFNPRFRWNWALLAQGGTAGANKVLLNPDEGGKFKGRRDCGDLAKASKAGGGSQTNASATENTVNAEGRKADEEVEKARHMHSRALTRSAVNSITADLVVVGDPDIGALDVATYATVAIAFINPFHLLGGTCPEWQSRGLEGTPCNEVLSNREWLVNSVTQKITAGKFTTTLNVTLPVPGSHFDFGTPLGGDSKGKVVSPR